MRVSELPRWAEGILTAPPATAARARLRETRGADRRAVEVDIPFVVGTLDRVRDWLLSTPGPEVGEIRIDFYDGSGVAVRGGRSVTVHGEPIQAEELGDDLEAGLAAPPPPSPPPASTTYRAPPAAPPATRPPGMIGAIPNENGPPIPTAPQDVRARLFQDAANAGNYLMAFMLGELETLRAELRDTRIAHAAELERLHARHAAELAAERSDHAAERRELVGLAGSSVKVVSDTARALTGTVTDTTKAVRDMVDSKDDLQGELIAMTIKAREAQATAEAAQRIAEHKAEHGAPPAEESPAEEVKAWIGLVKEAGGLIGDLRGTASATPIFKALHAAYMKGDKRPLVEWLAKGASKEDVDKLGGILADPEILAALAGRMAA